VSAGAIAPKCIGIGYAEVGRQNTHDGLDGYVADAIIFNRILDANELAIVDTFIQNTYIPEPATMVLLGIGGVSLLIRRKR